MSLPKWLAILAQIGPQILALTPLRPIAGAVAQGIAHAQQLAGATGSEKLATVRAIAADAATAINAKAGHVEIDVDSMNAAAANAINTVVSVVNLVHAAHAEDMPEVPATPTPVASPAPPPVVPPNVAPV